MEMEFRIQNQLIDIGKKFGKKENCGFCIQDTGYSVFLFIFLYDFITNRCDKFLKVNLDDFKYRQICALKYILRKPDFPKFY